MENLQNLHVTLWLLKDCSWCSSWHWFGMSMTVPTIILAVQIAWHSRKTIADLIHNIAVCLWIFANIIWMTGEFFYDDGTRAEAKVFFYAGLALIGLYYGWELLRVMRPWPRG